jgi:hypothetical protein
MRVVSQDHCKVANPIKLGSLEKIRATNWAIWKSVQ